MSRWRAKRVFLAVFCLALVISGWQYRAQNWQVRQLGILDEPGSQDRVLIVAPHCDDEVLGAGGLLGRLQASGGEVRVVIMTNGDGFSRAARDDNLPRPTTSADFLALGHLRQEESKEALERLGLDSGQVYFLGYPDRGLYNLWTPAHWQEPYLSKYTGVDASPYTDSYHSALAYTGGNVILDLSRQIADFEPNYVFYPHPNDSHSDHWATYCFTKYVLTALGSTAKEYLYLVHRGAWPIVLSFSGRTYLAPPRRLRQGGREWFMLELTEDEIKQKRQALKEYRSQMRVMEFVLQAFCRKNELFALYPDSEIRESAEREIIWEEHLLAENPVGDLPLYHVQISADLVSLAGVVDTDDNLQLALTARGKINEIMNYSFDMFFYFEEQVQSRLVVTWQHGKTQGLLYSDQGVTLLTDVVTKADGKTLFLTVPNCYWLGAQRVFMGCVSGQGRVRIDNMAWRIYRLPGRPADHARCME